MKLAHFSLVTAIVICLSMASVPSVQALTLFSDDFENDTLGSLPTIGGGDIGSGYTQVSATVANTDVENDAASVTLEARAGQYLNAANDGVESGNIIADFASQSSGTLTATFDANVIGAADGGSVRMTFMNAGSYVSGIHSGYLVTGFWLTDQAEISLPAGVDADDVVIAYHDGSIYKVLKKDGGTEAEGAAIDGEGLWHTVTLTQDAAIGGFPQFSLNGVLLESIPLGNSLGDIDGLHFGSNGGENSQGYVDNLSIDGIPEPCSAVLLVLGSLLGFAGLGRRQR